MPKTEEEIPEKLRPFIRHGLQLKYGRGDKEARGDCPWCDSPKFTVDITTGQWRCFACNEGNEKGKVEKGGNARTFIRHLWERSYKETTSLDYEELTLDRKLLPDRDTFLELQCAKSLINGNWLIPGYNAEGKLNTVYQWVSSGKRTFLLPTDGLGHQLFLMNQLNPEASTIYLCEGFWDGAALWEALGACKEATTGRLVATANRSASLLADSSVLAIAGNLVFIESWCPLFDGKRVRLMAQNDHPKPHGKTGEPLPPASYTGMERICRMLSGHAAEIELCHWGEGGFDPKLPSGYDVRDALNV